MEYEEFFESVKHCVEEKLGKEYTVYRKRIRKNNNVWLNGIVIRHGDERICPTIYLDNYYCEIEEGKEIDDISAEVLERYQETRKYPGEQKVDLSYKYVKDKIIYRLVNKEKNEEMLQECPMIPFLDLAVTFHVLMNGKPEREQASIRITNEMMDIWNLDMETLRILAEKNTKKCLPPVIYTMHEMIGKLMFDGMQQLEIEDLFQEYGEGWQEEKKNRELEMEMEAEHLGQGISQTEMYVLTNEQNINGATAVLYKNIVQDFSDKIQSDLYLLPSSVHEFILIPARYHFNREDLEDMVQSVNRNQLPREEFLSDFVYYYSQTERKIKKL